MPYLRRQGVEQGSGVVGVRLEQRPPSRRLAIKLFVNLGLKFPGFGIKELEFEQVPEFPHLTPKAFYSGHLGCFLGDGEQCQFCHSAMQKKVDNGVAIKAGDGGLALCNAVNRLGPAVKTGDDALIDHVAQQCWHIVCEGRLEIR